MIFFMPITLLLCIISWKKSVVNAENIKPALQQNDMKDTAFMTGK